MLRQAAYVLHIVGMENKPIYSFLYRVAQRPWSVALFSTHYDTKAEHKGKIHRFRRHSCFFPHGRLSQIYTSGYNGS